MEFPTSIVEPAPPETLREAEATVLDSPARYWVFGALTEKGYGRREDGRKTYRPYVEALHARPLA